MPYFRSPCGAQMPQFPMQQMPAPSYESEVIVPPSQIIPPLPSGVPTGPAYGNIPQGAMTPAVPPAQQVPQTVESPMYTPGFLRTQIGRKMRVEFLIGTSGPLVDRIGTLLAVGASYILIRPIDSDDILMCDIYSIKFVTILL